MASMFSALYATPGEQSPLPTIFELLFVDRMRGSVRPAFDHLLFVLSQRVPTLLWTAVPWKDELFALIMYGLESYFLNRQGASFSEAFHGLQRKRAVADPAAKLAASRGQASSSTPSSVASSASTGATLAAIADATAGVAARASRSRSAQALSPAASASSPAATGAAGTRVGKFGTRHHDFEPGRDRAVSLFCLVLLPYLWHKLSSYCAALALEEEERRFLSNSGPSSRAASAADSSSATEQGVPDFQQLVRNGKVLEILRWLWDRVPKSRMVWKRAFTQTFLYCFPLVDSLAGLVGLSFRIRYLLERTEFASPLLKLSGLVLVRRPPTSTSSVAKETVAPSASSPSGWLGRYAVYGAAGAQFLWAASLMALKIFEWFAANNANGELNGGLVGPQGSSGQRTSGDSSPRAVLRPPAQHVQLRREDPEKQVSSKKTQTGLAVGTATTAPIVGSACPICQRDPVVNPAATFSGYVFCYTCVVAFVKEHKTCPATGLPCTEDQVRQLIPM
eukprot:INCI10007.1.p1 GENE.INCI10007.1~~INCI10007.1.p1  ORF type:complete len:507 (-),score=68.65 INCI10007.1:104-1624(-)